MKMRMQANILIRISKATNIPIKQMFQDHRQGDNDKSLLSTSVATSHPSLQPTPLSLPFNWWSKNVDKKIELVPSLCLRFNLPTPPPPALPSAPAGCSGGVAAFVGELGLFTGANFENVPRHYWLSPSYFCLFLTGNDVEPPPRRSSPLLQSKRHRQNSGRTGDECPR